MLLLPWTWCWHCSIESTSEQGISRSRSQVTGKASYKNSFASVTGSFPVMGSFPVTLVCLVIHLISLIVVVSLWTTLPEVLISGYLFLHWT
jgi:hypothetical protein